MGKIELEKKDDGKQAFALYANGLRAGEMVISVHGNELTVGHTEVAPAYRGQGVGLKLIDAMVNYVRSHRMKVAVLCPYTYAQLNRHPEKHADVWNKRKRPISHI